MESYLALKSGSRNYSFFLRRNLMAKIGNPIEKMMMPIAIARSTFP